MHIEAKTLKYLISAAGDELIKEAVKGDLDAVGDVVTGDYADPVFQRGCLHGMQMILDCRGLPSFLTGEAVKHLKIFLLMASKEIAPEEAAHG